MGAVDCIEGGTGILGVLWCLDICALGGGFGKGTRWDRHFGDVEHRFVLTRHPASQGVGGLELIVSKFGTFAKTISIEEELLKLLSGAKAWPIQYFDEP